MSEISNLWFWLLAETSLLLLAAAVFFAIRYKGLAGKIRDYLERRLAFEQALAKTAKDLAQNFEQRVKERVEQGDLGEETARLLEQSRTSFVEGALEAFREVKGEQSNFWNGVYTKFLEAMLTMSERIEELLGSSAAEESENLDPQDDDIGVADADDEADAQAPELDIQEDSSGEAVIAAPDTGIVHDDSEELDNLRRIIRFQTRKIDELVDFRRRFGDLQVSFHNIRASNTRLKQQLYDLVWKKDATNEQSEEMEQIMTEFERSNQELKLCVDTLESENERLRGAVEGIGDQQEKYADQVSQIAAKDDEILAEQVGTLEQNLDVVSKERDALQEELRVLQREYVSLYAQQQARTQGLNT